MYINDIPTLKEYTEEPTLHNYEKMCVELEELIVNVYSKITTETEREIYYKHMRSANRIIKL